MYSLAEFVFAVLIAVGTYVFVTKVVKTIDRIEKEKIAKRTWDSNRFRKYNTIVDIDRTDRGAIRKPTKPQQSNRTRPSEDSNHRSTKSSKVSEDDNDDSEHTHQQISVDEITTQILKVYHGQEVPNKKETIVNLLRYLYRFDTSGDFLDDNPNIRAFVFR